MRGRGELGVLCGALALGCGQAPAAASGSTSVLTLLHTSDSHSRVWPFRSRISAFQAELGLGEAFALTEVGGAARLATLLARARARGPVLWLDSGDALEGAEVFHRLGGRLEAELLSALGLGAMALGNHELSLDGETLGELLTSAAAFPVLAANLRPRPTSTLAASLLPSALLDVAGVRVAVVGVANPGSPPGLANAENPWQLELASELSSAVQAALDDVAPQAGLVVVLSHLGLEADHALVRSTTGIDLVLGGHQHVQTVEPEWEADCSTNEVSGRRGCSPRRVPIVHSGAYLQWLSRLELRLELELGNPRAYEVAELALTQLPLAADVPADAEVESYLEARRLPPEAPLAFLPSKLGRRSPVGGDSALGNLTTDAMLAATGADVALVNSSGLRANLEAGALLHFPNLELAFPFDEAWRLVWLSGRTLRRGLERAARRSATRGCEAALQVSGLRLTLQCRACATGSESCLTVQRTGPGGATALEDDAWLLVTLPVYLTLVGSDFDEVGSLGSDLAVLPAQALARSWGQTALTRDTGACAAGLEALSETRCREAFGSLACPLALPQARAACATLPWVEEARDGRIEMVP